VKPLKQKNSSGTQEGDRPQRTDGPMAPTESAEKGYRGGGPVGKGGKHYVSGDEVEDRRTAREKRAKSEERRPSEWGTDGACGRKKRDTRKTEEACLKATEHPGEAENKPRQRTAGKKRAHHKTRAWGGGARQEAVQQSVTRRRTAKSDNEGAQWREQNAQPV